MAMTDEEATKTVKGLLQKPVGYRSLRGSGESLGSLAENAGFIQEKVTNKDGSVSYKEREMTAAEKAERGGVGSRRNILDSVREGLASIGLAPSIENIDFSTRKIENGMVVPNAADALYRVSQPELQYQYEKYRRANLDGTKGGSDYFGTFKQKPSQAMLADGVYAPTSLNEEDVIKQVNTENTRRDDVKQKLQGLEAYVVNADGLAEKTRLLKELRGKGDALTVADINGASALLVQYNPETINSREQVKASIANTKAQTANTEEQTGAISRRLDIAQQTANDTRDYQQGQLNLESRIAHNANLINIRNADISEINATNKTIELQNAQRNAELDRQLRKDLAVFGFEDKAADRSYQRERDSRQDRQMMILQLMKGLSSLGSNIAI